MKDDEIFAMAVEKGLVKEGGNFFAPSINHYAFQELFNFARAIADIQKQKDALICDNCPKRGEQ